MLDQAPDGRTKLPPFRCRGQHLWATALYNEVMPIARSERCRACGKRIEDLPPAIATAGVAYEGDGGRIVRRVSCWHGILGHVAGEVVEIQYQQARPGRIAADRSTKGVP